MRKNKTTRLKMDVAEGTLARLESLMERTEASDYAEVIKHALRLFEFVIRAEIGGCALLAQWPDFSTRAMPLYENTANAGVGKQKTATISIEVAESALARLDFLRVSTDSTTYAEVIKLALHMYAFAIQTAMDGCTLLAQRPDGSTQPLSVFETPEEVGIMSEGDALV